MRSSFDFFYILISLIPCWLFYFINQNAFKIESNINILFITLIVFMLGIFFSYIFIKIYKSLLPRNETIEVKTIRPAELDFIPTHIAYFLIAIGIEKLIVFFITMLFLTICIWKTKFFYFNFFLLFIGYNFYKVVSESDNEFLIISKQKNLKHGARFENLHRLNNYTFIE